MRAVSILLVLLIPAPLAGGAETAHEPTTRPAEREWGETVRGLQLSLAFDGAVAFGGQFRCDVHLRNVGQVAVALPDNAPGPDEPFGWLFVVQQIGDEKKAFYTEKIPLARGLTVWPRALPGGEALDLVPDTVSERTVRAYKAGVKVVEGYPVDPDPGKPLPDEPIKRLKAVLAPGPVTCRLMLYLPGKDPGAIMIASNTVRAMVAPPDFAGLSGEGRKTFTDNLLGQFDRSAWGGQGAHRVAVQIGPPILPALLEAVAQRSRPAHSRMWLATAVADIRDDLAAEALTKLLDDPLAGVRHVVAYHGPKQRSDKLDAAIIARGAAGDDSPLTAYSLLGFLVHRGRAPEELLLAGLENPDGRVQTAVRSAFKHYASDHAVARLRELAGGVDPRLAKVAQQVLEAMGRPGPTTGPSQ